MKDKVSNAQLEVREWRPLFNFHNFHIYGGWDCGSQKVALSTATDHSSPGPKAMAGLLSKQQCGELGGNSTSHCVHQSLHWLHPHFLRELSFDCTDWPRKRKKTIFHFNQFWRNPDLTFSHVFQNHNFDPVPSGHIMGPFRIQSVKLHHHFLIIDCSFHLSLAFWFG